MKEAYVKEALPKVDSWLKSDLQVSLNISVLLKDLKITFQQRELALGSASFTLASEIDNGFSLAVWD